ncbi:MAG TPA: transposase [Blastocatellia bacterium]|nr:transposase [Blastocatellia bacterium]
MTVPERDEFEIKMAQTLVRLLVHIIFSTKHRADLIEPEIESELFAYIAGIAKNNNSKLITAGGTKNHVHLLISLSKTISLSSTLYIFLRKRYGEFRAFLFISFSFEISRADWDVSKILEFPYLVCNEEVTPYLLIQPLQ